MKRRRVFMYVGVSLLAGLPGMTQVAATPAVGDGHDAMVRQVAAMAGDPRAQALAARHQLQILNVLWEDTGRFLGSSVGPNISDVTIEVELAGGGGRGTALMPVLRHPNFSDRTGDVPLDRIKIPVGNHLASGRAIAGGPRDRGRAAGAAGPAGRPRGASLTTITLRELLANPGRYLSLPGSGQIRGGSLLAPRDAHALVSAQATFLPVPARGRATFYPVIFNYQSTREEPAVLTLLVTRQGTSVTVVDNARDTLQSNGHGSWGQRLFFNSGGNRAPLTAERWSAVTAAGKTANGEAADSLGGDANLLMIVQVPLKVRRPARMLQFAPAAADAAVAGVAMARRKGGESDVEAAVLGHGPLLGPYTELAGHTIERDPRFPVRVTVQFYQATSNGVIAESDVQTLAAQIDRVYQSADYVGSLVVPAPGEKRRPTAWDGVAPMPPGTRCQDFPGLVERGLCPPQLSRRVLVPARPGGAGIDYAGAK